MTVVPLPLEQTLPGGELIHGAEGGSVVRRSVLPPGGVRVLTEAMPGQRSATIGFWVAVGSRDEADGQHGSTHFLEHLLFKGTKRRTALEIASAFDEVGANPMRPPPRKAPATSPGSWIRTFPWPLMSSLT